MGHLGPLLVWGVSLSPQRWGRGPQPCGEAGRLLCLLTTLDFTPAPTPPKQGTPKLLRTSVCDFVFEWETPLVCPHEVKTEGCSSRTSSCTTAQPVQPLQEHLQGNTVPQSL